MLSFLLKERTKEETEMKVDETATFPNNGVDNMATLYNNLNEVSGNLITAVEVLQKNVDPAAGNENILPISLSEEDKIFISTQIAEKLNEEEAIEPIEQPAEGVTNEELGIEVRDSLRAIKEDIAENKNILIKIIRAVREKAMTFDQIYFGVFDRLAREYESETGRRVR